MGRRTYEFVTVWRLDAPVERVWREVYHSEHWPEWWRGVRSVEMLEAGDERGVGNLRRYTWQSALPYKLVFNVRVVRIEPFSIIEGCAEGHLSGVGRWQFTTEEQVTVVRYDWQVEATKKWMKMLAPLARPLFEWNHDVVMRWGFKGLQKRLISNLQIENAI
jgi:uncharacterized protein YndB with AHSA1/START domain